LTSQWHKQVQILCGCGFVLLCLYIHDANKPFLDATLNRVESFGILIPGITLYPGIYYNAQDMTTAGRLCIFILMIMLNVIFLALWTRRNSSSFIRLFHRWNSVKKHGVKPLESTSFLPFPSSLRANKL